MVFDLFSFQPPYPILLIISLVSSSIVTHKKWLCYFNMILLALQCFYYLLLSLSYIDAWIGLIISLIIINNRVSLSLELSRISPAQSQLNKAETIIYDKHFKPHLMPEQFKYLFSKGKMVKTKSVFVYATEGAPFDKIYYFASISSKDAVFLSSNSMKLFSVEENCWIGVVEFLSYQKENADNSSQKWMNSVDCDSSSCEVCYYEWSKEVFKNIFLYSIDHVLLNNLVLMWNRSNATFIEELNRNIFGEMNKIGNPYENGSLTNRKFIRAVKAIPSSKDKGRDEDDNDDDLIEPLLPTN